MSPEYKNINQLPNVFKRKVRDRLLQDGCGFDFQEAVAQGFGFCLPSSEDPITKISLLTDLKPTVLADGMKQSSNWHLVKGLYDSSKSEKFNQASFGEHYNFTKIYRSVKHRSVNKGTGLAALFRNPKRRRNH